MPRPPARTQSSARERPRRTAPTPRPPTKRPLPLSPSPTSTSSTRPLAVAITGGIGAGKSAALEAFARHGAVTRSSDETVHRLLQSDPEVLAAISEHFGPQIVGEQGADRAAIAAIVFENRAELDWLEGLLHPKVVREHAAWLQELRDRPDPPAVSVTEVPLLYETGGDRRFDAVVVITASRENRAARRPVDDERERRLIPDEQKVERADFAYLNDGTLDELDEFVAGVMDELTA